MGKSLFEQRVSHVHLMEEHGYLSYLWALTKSHSLYRGLQRYVNYFRRFRLISFILKMTGTLFLLLETGTLFFLFICLTLLALPFVGALFLVYYTVSLLFLPHDRRRLQQQICEKKVYVFLLTRQNRFSRGTFEVENILSFAAQKENAVLVISPFVFFGQGITQQRKFYLNIRQEASGIWLVRKHCFFSIRSHILKKISDHVTLIY